MYNVCKKQHKGFNKRKVNKELGNQLISNATSSAISFKMDNGIWKLASSNKKKSKCNMNKVKPKVACAARLIIQRRDHTYQMTESRNATLFWHNLPHLYFKANA